MPRKKEDKFAPGSFGCHEALHMAAFLMTAVANELSGHDAIKQNAKWLKLADKAHDALFDLYQAIGKEHL